MVHDVMAMTGYSTAATPLGAAVYNSIATFFVGRKKKRNFKHVLPVWVGTTVFVYVAFSLKHLTATISYQDHHQEERLLRNSLLNTSFSYERWKGNITCKMVAKQRIRMANEKHSKNITQRGNVAKSSVQNLSFSF